jgi:hypothetical protein
VRVGDKRSQGKQKLHLLSKKISFILYVSTYSNYTGIYTHITLLSPKRIKNLIQILFLHICKRFCGKCERDTGESVHCPEGFNINKSSTSIGKIFHQQLGSETLLMDRPRLCTECKNFLNNENITEHHFLLQDTLVSKK